MKNYIHHIVITVSNAKRSTEFYAKILGDEWKIREQTDTYSYFVPDEKKYPDTRCMLVLGEPRENPIPGDKFDRNRIGLDHFAFNVDSKEELDEMESRFKKLGIEMEEGGITDDDFGGTAIFCYDPDGMKLEFHLHKK